MNMLPEDIRRIELLKREILHLKCTGDDQQNQNDRRSCYASINRIKDKYETHESRAHKQDLKLAREQRAFEKRNKIQKTKQKIINANLKTLTPKQIAINKVVTSTTG